MKIVPLSSLANVIRSKNAGPFLLTFDVLFNDKDIFSQVWESNAFAAENLAKLFGISVTRIKSIYAMPKGNAIKFTLQRPRTQGSIGETDMYGCQQHSPLLDLPINLN